MPRRSRIDAPDALHHIMVRGIDRHNIFRDQKCIVTGQSESAGQNRHEIEGETSDGI